jgi:hypothetical protein
MTIQQVAATIAGRIFEPQGCLEHLERFTTMISSLFADYRCNARVLYSGKFK